MNSPNKAVRFLGIANKTHFAIFLLATSGSFILASIFGSALLWIVLPVFSTAFLLVERHRNLRALHTRENKLLEISQRFQLALDSSDIGLWEIDDNGSCYLDDRSARLHEFGIHKIDVSVSQWLSAILSEDREKASTFLSNCTKGDHTVSEVYRVVGKGGGIRYVRAAGASYLTQDGSSRTTGIMWDVTADMRMAQTLKESKYSSDVKNAELELALQELSAREHDLTTLSRRLDLALESYNCGIWEADLRDNSAYWDPRMHQLYGLPFKGNGLTTRQMWLDCLHPNDRQSAVETADRSAERNETLLNVHRILLATGDIRYIRSVGQVHTARDGTRRIVGIAFDVTEDHRLAEELKAAKDEAEARNAELIEAKSRIEHNALHDPLTGLANRRRLDDELDLLSTPSVGPDHKRFAILHLDLDRFKQINDTLGHAAGDAMLVHTAEILRRSVHDGDVVARIGGDEFVILTSHMGDKDHVKTVAANIIGAFKHPFDFQGFTCRCGVSIGIAFGESNSSDARKTLINADLALYRAKALGRNRYEFFTQNLQAELVNHKRMADEILAGLENGEFETWYQPQFCIQSGNIVGIEALVRWRHPTRGLLTPDKFLKIAEELNVVQALDRIVLQTALQDRRTWNLRGLNIPRVAVNVSLRRLHDEHLVESLKELSIQPGEVTFELVESIFLDDSEELVVRNIERIKSLGIDIEIDDFGTGHTSLISLLRLKPNRLKIDRQLVMPILASPQERALVRSIIDIARSLGVETVAEGVETHGHATMLRQMGCDIAQGYAFSKPLPAQDFASFATSDSWRGFPQPLQEITA